MSIEIEKSVQERVQAVFVQHFQSASDMPIPRNEFIQSGWNQQTYLTYYHFNHLMYFAYMNYKGQLCSSLEFSSKADGELTLCKNARRVLGDACKKMKGFFNEVIGFNLDIVHCCPFIEATLDSGENTNEFSSIQHFISALEYFIGEQIVYVKKPKDSSDLIRANACKVFVDYYNAYSRNYIDPRPTISKESFLAVGWTMQIYRQYHNITSRLYYPLMLQKDQWAPMECFGLWKTEKKCSTSQTDVSEIVSNTVREFFAFIKRHLHVTLQITEELNYILGMHAGIVWCHPYDKPYTMNTNLCDSLVFFASYDQFLSWLEYEIGNQIVNPPVEAAGVANQVEIQQRKIPVDEPWYKLPYNDLKKYRLENTWPVRENVRTELLQFDNFNAPDAAEQFWTLIFEFIKQDNFDEDVVNRLEEYEDYNFDVEGDILYIYKGETKCFREHHNIESVTAKVLARRGNMVDININCCCDCHKYFISESEFFHYRDLYGIVCGLKIDRHSTGYAKFPMAEYSVLRLYGYNVGKEDNLSDEERQNLLKILIEHDYVKKPEIIKYLQMFIKMNRGRLEMADSVSKWTADLDYVRELGLENQKKVLLEKIEYAH